MCGLTRCWESFGSRRFYEFARENIRDFEIEAALDPGYASKLIEFTIDFMITEMLILIPMLDQYSPSTQAMTISSHLFYCNLFFLRGLFLTFNLPEQQSFPNTFVWSFMSSGRR
jgi:hypothetical protein